jgi:hypothetical protein
MRTRMTSFRGRLTTIIVFLGILGTAWAASLLIHELEHRLTAQILGGRVTQLNVWPGIQVWPNPGQPVDGEWGTSIASIAYTYGPTWGEDGGWQDPVVGIMGSGINLLLAALALASLWLFRPQGWLRPLLLAESLMFVDLLFYALLPELFGLPHYLILGGGIPEPIDNAELLGFPRWGGMLLTVLVSALMAWGWVAYVRRHPAQRDPESPLAR